MDRWVGRVAIVTGTSAGIGVAIARILVENGMKVVAVARRLDRIKVLEEEVKGMKGELHAIKCDVTIEKEVIEMVKWTRDNLGGADVLVNNAGVGNRMPLTELDTVKFHNVINTNVLGLLVLTREVIKDMRDRGIDDGHIFNINSTFGHIIVDVPNSYIYQISKHAVTVLTEGLRRELRDLNTRIKVTSLSPGLVKSEIGLAYGLSEEEHERRYKIQPCLEAIDIAEALLYALSTRPHVQIHELTIQPVAGYP